MTKNPPRQGRFFTALLRRAASAAFDAGSPWVGRPESIKLKGPRCAVRSGVGKRPRGALFYGASAPRRECGVRRREPLGGATGVYSIKRAPAALCAVGWRSAPGRFDKRKKCGRAAARMIYDCLFRIRHSRALRRVISLVRASTRSYWGVSTRGVPSRTRGRRRCLHRKMHRRFQPQVRGVAKTGTDGQMGSCSDMIGSSLRSRAAPGLLPAAGACFSPRHQCSTDGGNILSKTVGKGVFSKIFSDFFEKGPEKPRFSRSFSGKRAKAGDFSKRRGPGGGDISPKMG